MSKMRILSDGYLYFLTSLFVTSLTFNRLCVMVGIIKEVEGASCVTGKTPAATTSRAFYTWVQTRLCFCNCISNAAGLQRSCLKGWLFRARTNRRIVPAALMRPLFGFVGDEGRLSCPVSFNFISNSFLSTDPTSQTTQWFYLLLNNVSYEATWDTITSSTYLYRVLHF